MLSRLLLEQFVNGLPRVLGFRVVKITNDLTPFFFRQHMDVGEPDLHICGHGLQNLKIMHHHPLHRIFKEELASIFYIEANLYILFCCRNHQIELGCSVIEVIRLYKKFTKPYFPDADVIYSKHRIKQRITADIPSYIQPFE